MIKAIKPKDSKLWRDSYYHRLFGFKAAKEAGRVLKFFEKERPDDMRPREVIEVLPDKLSGAGMCLLMPWVLLAMRAELLFQAGNDTQ